MKHIFLSLFLFPAAVFAADPVPQGSWGAPHIHLNVTAQGGHIEFDCAHAEIEEPLVLNSSGGFLVRGTFHREQGGPVRPGHELPPAPAVFSGSLSADQKMMKLTIALEEPQLPRLYTLRFGESGPVFKCL